MRQTGGNFTRRSLEDVVFGQLWDFQLKVGVKSGSLLARTIKPRVWAEPIIAIDRRHSDEQSAAQAAERLSRVGLVVLDDTFLPEASPERPRIALRGLHSLQQALAPTKSVLLAPGESWAVIGDAGGASGK